MKKDGYQPQRTCRTCATYDDCALAFYHGQSYNYCERYKEVVPSPPTSGSNAHKAPDTLVDKKEIVKEIIEELKQKLSYLSVSDNILLSSIAKKYGVEL